MQALGGRQSACSGCEVTEVAGAQGRWKTARQEAAALSRGASRVTAFELEFLYELWLPSLLATHAITESWKVFCLSKNPVLQNLLNGAYIDSNFKT